MNDSVYDEDYPHGHIVAWGIDADLPENPPGRVVYWLTKGAKDLDRIVVPVGKRWGIARDMRSVALAIDTPVDGGVELQLIAYFATDQQAEEFAGALRKALQSLNGDYLWIAERWDWKNGWTVGQADSLLVIPTTAKKNLTVDDITHSVWKTESDRYRRLQQGEEVDGKILITLVHARRLGRLADTVGSVLASIDGHVIADDLEQLGFTLERTDR